MGELTILIASARAGDSGAIGQLYELLYTELRQIAHAKMRQSGDQTLLGTTALINESYLRLVKLGKLQIADRAHFLAYAARTMRSVLVDFARQRLAQRRGGDHLQVTLDTEIADAATAESEQIVRVHEALQELAALDERLVQVVEMRYFAGLEEQEIAEALGVSVRTVQRDWDKARTFLFAQLK